MREPVFALAWGTLLAALALVLALWTPHAELQWAPLAGAAVATWLGALVLLRRRRQRERALPDLSPPTLLFGLGLAAMLNGAYFGRWLLLIGAGVALLGLAGVARELRAPRRVR